MTKRGIDLRFDARVRSIGRCKGGLAVDLEHGESVECGLVLYATGRRPIVTDLGLDIAGVELDARGGIGMHRVAPDAGEMVQGFPVAMNAGAKKADFDRTIGIHPTAAEEFVTMRTPEPELPED